MSAEKVEPILRITKIERGWYSYEVRVGATWRIGHGGRDFVKQAVDRALRDSGAVRR